MPYPTFISFLASWLMLAGLQYHSLVTAFVPLSPITPFLKPKTRLFYLNDERKLPSDSDLIQQIGQREQPQDTPPLSSRCRASIGGVSLAEDGFWAVLRVANDGYVAWQVTKDPADAKAATSPEALTLIQLLSGVDMAGAILPPDLLSKIVVMECERIIQQRNREGMFIQDEVMVLAQTVLKEVQASLPQEHATTPYSEAHEWVQSRATLPQVAMDEITVYTNGKGESSFQWTCQIEKRGSLALEPTPEMLQSVLYQYSPDTSLPFCSLCLALRYQTPITVVLEDEYVISDKQDNGEDNMIQATPVLTLAALQEQFPMYATKQSLQQKSNLVQENIVRGFEIHKLTGALNIATKLGDSAAAKKIRQALDEFDSMDDLPTMPGGAEGGIVMENDDDNDEEGEDKGTGLDSMQ